jgi:hypothetical protein
MVGATVLERTDSSKLENLSDNLNSLASKRKQHAGTMISWT